MRHGNTSDFKCVDQLVRQDYYSDEQAESALLTAAELPVVQQALDRLYATDVATASVASLYSGFRSELLWERNGWALSICRITSTAQALSVPAGQSHALYLTGSCSIVCDGYSDQSDWEPLDLRPPTPLSKLGERRLAQGEFLHIRNRAEFFVPREIDDAVFLKLEGPACIPLSVAFRRDDLRQDSLSFSDQKYTAIDFFASLMAHLMRDEGGDFLNTFEDSEKSALLDFVERQATDPDIHLVSRWKFIQALGCLSKSDTEKALEQIAADSSSVIGQNARRILARARNS